MAVGFTETLPVMPLTIFRSEPLDAFVPDSGSEPLMSPASAGGMLSANAETANAKANNRETDMTTPPDS
jgi:hypothetical protein